ncbi:protein bric-a-brac 2 isoform X2 [Manduca sexta]|uniref:protein bric-a-brac 2 isoform X2 n=2 Tax=Manduca sexta TaxID=7130 RepID=UPI0011840693|nr:protein bric-a-brac 2 isoform X2 [Manduca sexta]
MSQQYSLRWNNHQPNFISMFTTLLNTQTLVDVTLAAEGKHLQAHKVVLSACSTYFQSLFVENPSRHPIVILKDVTFADLRTMVDFMYYGEVNVTEEQLPQVLDTAKLLKIKGLTEMPDSTSLTRSQGTSADFQSPGESVDSQRHSASPTTSPSNKRRRKSSTGSTSLNMVIGEDARPEDVHNLEMMRAGESITLSSVPQQRRRDFDDRPLDGGQPNAEAQNLNVEPVGMEPNASGMPQGYGRRRPLAGAQLPRGEPSGPGAGAARADQAPPRHQPPIRREFPAGTRGCPLWWYRVLQGCKNVWRQQPYSVARVQEEGVPEQQAQYQEQDQAGAYYPPTGTERGDGAARETNGFDLSATFRTSRIYRQSAYRLPFARSHPYFTTEHFGCEFQRDTIEHGLRTVSSQRHIFLVTRLVRRADAHANGRGAGAAAGAAVVGALGAADAGGLPLRARAGAAHRPEYLYARFAMNVGGSNWCTMRSALFTVRNNVLVQLK